MVEAKYTKKGMYVLLNNDVFFVTRKEIVTYGTHSHSKTKLFARPLLGGMEKSFVFAHHDKVEEANIIKGVGQILSLSENVVQIMDKKTFETFDASISNEIIERVKESDEVFYVSFNGSTNVLKPAKD
jgi:translation initiation factor 5A